MLDLVTDTAELVQVFKKSGSRLRVKKIMQSLPEGTSSLLQNVRAFKLISYTDYIMSLFVHVYCL